MKGPFRLSVVAGLYKSHFVVSLILRIHISLIHTEGVNWFSVWLIVQISRCLFWDTNLYSYILHTKYTTICIHNLKLFGTPVWLSYVCTHCWKCLYDFIKGVFSFLSNSQLKQLLHYTFYMKDKLNRSLIWLFQLNNTKSYVFQSLINCVIIIVVVVVIDCKHFRLNLI